MTCNGSPTRTVAPASKIYSEIRHSGARNFSTLTSNIFPSKPWIVSSVIPRRIQRVIGHPMVDAYYDAMVPTREQFAKITLPILTITGQYDGDELGALAHYRDHLANASAETRAKHFLIIGPWDHAGTRTPTDEVGGIKFGGAAVIDLNDLHRQWYDWTMKSGRKPEFLKDRVAYYLLAPGNSGANGEWKYADDFEKLTANHHAFYLDASDEGGNGVFHSGTLGEKPAGTGADEYIYDP